MFCIAAFIVLVVIGIFSAKYRAMMKKAWGCVGRKLTLKPCDTNFKKDLKDHMLAKVANKSPKLVKSADIAIEVGAVLIVLLTIWSLYVVVVSGLNLYVYGTCSPSNSAACSLGAEACSIEKDTIGITEAITSLKIHTYVSQEARGLFDTISAIPARVKTWDATQYVPRNATYEKPFAQEKPTAIEIIDPGCQFCRELYLNMKESKLSDRYNLTYIAFPIPSSDQESGYKFQHSYVITTYLESMRLIPIAGSEVPSDWQLLDILFTEKDGRWDNQTNINSIWTDAEMEEKLAEWLMRIGYSDAQITDIQLRSASPEVADIIAANNRMVKDEIKTVKIPTTIFDGRRTGGVLSAEQLR